MWFSVDLRCQNPDCGWTWDTLLKKEPGSSPDALLFPCCPQCEGLEVRRAPSAPNHTRASYVDGTKRFGKLKAQDALETAALSARDAADTTRIAKELSTLSTKKG